MEAKEVLLALRTKRGFSQEELAERLFVTRQAVSRWEMGETLPGPETLQRLSALYDVSINTLLGSPRRLVCQCCGMPLEDDGVLSREPDGSFNEDYCKWCYTGGKFVYSSLEELIEFLAGTMATAEWPPEQVRAYLRARLQARALEGENEEKKSGGKIFPPPFYREPGKRLCSYPFPSKAIK